MEIHVGLIKYCRHLKWPSEWVAETHIRHPEGEKQREKRDR